MEETSRALPKQQSTTYTGCMQKRGQDKLYARHVACSGQRLTFVFDALCSLAFVFHAVCT